MRTRQLGNTDLEITPLGLGTWAIGGGNWQFGWGPQDDETSIATIHRALDLGINWIDTAAVYGLGHSEEIVAKALQGRSTRPYVFTKGSRVWNDKGEITSSLKEQSLRREVENSPHSAVSDNIFCILSVASTTCFSYSHKYGVKNGRQSCSLYIDRVH